MPRYERTTTVTAPLETVWDFHARVEGLTAVTPDWLHLRVEEVTPPGEPDGVQLSTGTRVRLSVRPFGVGPRRTWTSVIRESRADDEVAFLRDEMVDGPFPHWVHTHRFVATEGSSQAVTRIEDSVEYRLPGGAIGRALGRLAWLGFEPLFRFRHYRTRQVLERSAGSTDHPVSRA